MKRRGLTRGSGMIGSGGTNDKNEPDYIYDIVSFESSVFTAACLLGHFKVLISEKKNDLQFKPLSFIITLQKVISAIFDRSFWNLVP